MFEQAFRNIDDVLRKEAGCTTELDYTGTFNLSVKNHDDSEVVAPRSPQEILEELAVLDGESAEVSEKIGQLFHLEAKT